MRVLSTTPPMHEPNCGMRLRGLRGVSAGRRRGGRRRATHGTWSWPEPSPISFNSQGMGATA